MARKANKHSDAIPLFIMGIFGAFIAIGILFFNFDLRGEVDTRFERLVNGLGSAVISFIFLFFGIRIWRKFS